MSGSLTDRITAVLRQHQSKQHADTTSRPGFRIWRDGCSGCDWLGARADHAAHVAEQIAAELNLREERIHATDPLYEPNQRRWVSAWTAVEDRP